MAVLSLSEYDASYFDGANQAYQHNAGYSNYSKIQYEQKGLFADRGVPIEQSTGNVFGDLCKSLNITLTNRFIGKKLLVLGAAYGFEVENFRALGIDAWGVEVSPFAISKASPTVSPYLINSDAITYLKTQARNGWDYMFSRWFLECFSDSDLSTLITEMNRVARSEQVHIVFPDITPPVYYNPKTVAQYAAMSFDRGTILIAHDDFNNYTIV